MMILNVTAFLPLYTGGKHDWDGVVAHRIQINETTKESQDVAYSVITSTENSAIISVFSIASIIFAPFNSFIKNKIGSKNSIILGFIMMGITTFGLGLITWINSS
jgi:MFS family permease